MNTPITKVLVANRGEIALRVMRTCRDLGIATVAVYSDADADAPHVEAADEAFRLGPAPSAESYLRVDRILEAARLTGADAIHPGYGFLSENESFAAACAAAGVTFIGPTAEAIREMGSKQRAKRIAEQAGVPVVPGYNGDDQSPERLITEAARVGFPCLLKASAGGGGKGMRIVRSTAELPDAIDAARREARSAFGDDTLLIERYVENPRHVEIQILGDAHGEVVHLFERECSIQRRHQKIIEESPSPALDPTLRARMGEAAVALGKAIGYRNAGTVEFILGADGAFYFLEVNTRLQVEHPVTEEVTGLDLVAEQLRVAAGEPLGYSQADLAQRGAALECRIYAEDPEGGFLPASGPVVRWSLPAREGLRVDGGVVSGSEVGVHYDPMLAKVITRGRDREQARRRMVAALRELVVVGLRTNREFLIELLEHPAYISGAIDTHFIDRHYPGGWRRSVTEATRQRAAEIAALVGHEARRAALPRLRQLPSGFRNNPVGPQWAEFVDETGARLRAAYWNRGPGQFTVVRGDEEHEVRLAASGDGRWWWEEATGHRVRVDVISNGARCWVQCGGVTVALEEAPRFPVPGSELAAGSCVAPMTGTVLQVQVEPGQTVEAGALLVIMEAMKMEHRVTAPEGGVVSAVHVAAGDLVDEGRVLVVVEPGEG